MVERQNKNDQKKNRMTKRISQKNGMTKKKDGKKKEE